MFLVFEIVPKVLEIKPMFNNVIQCGIARIVYVQEHVQAFGIQGKITKF